MDAVGTRENPYSWEAYDEMVRGLNWIGGWVMQAGGVVYITSSGHIEKDYGKDSLGSLSNPFSDTAYNEMHARGDWPGGYVSFGSVCEYRRSSAEENADASGCGSSGSGSDFGSGSGSGSGIGQLTPGSEVLSIGGRYAGEDGHYKVEISWGTSDGVTAKVVGFYSAYTGLVEMDSPLTIKEVGKYTYEISGLGSSFSYTIPEFYYKD